MNAPKPHSVAAFDAQAADWDQDPVKQARAAAVAEGIRAAVPLHGTMAAMEYGCGTGLLSFALAGELGRIVLADVSTGMLAEVERKIAVAGADHLSAQRLDLLADPLPEARFDLIYSLMTFHHIPDVATVLARCAALLKPGGALCVADLDAEDGSFHGADFDGHAGFERSTLGAQARAAGFEAVDFATVFEMHKPASNGQQRFPLFLMVARRPAHEVE